MTLKIFGWILILCSIAPFALLVHQIRSRVTFAKRHHRGAQTARFAQVGSWLGRAKLNGGNLQDIEDCGRGIPHCCRHWRCAVVSRPVSRGRRFR